MESQPGRGSIFRVFLPISMEAAIPKPVPMVEAPHPAGEGTVLLIEDEPIILKTVSTVIKRLGFTVLTAQDGVEAVELFGQHPDEIRLVVSDLTMPRMNGWETVTALRKIAPGIRIILSSGYSEAQALEGHHPELPQAFLSKPYEFKALSDALSQVLANQKG